MKEIALSMHPSKRKSEKVGLKSHTLLRSPKAHDKKLPLPSRAPTTHSLIMVFGTKNYQQEQPTLSNLQLQYTENKSIQPSPRVSGGTNGDLKQTGNRLHILRTLRALRLYRHVNLLSGFLHINAKNSLKERKAYITIC